MGSRSNGSQYPFKKHSQPFERLELSVQKKLSAVRTAPAIRSKTTVGRLKGSGYPFKRIRQPFEGERLELSELVLSVPKIQPFAWNDLSNEKV